MSSAVKRLIASGSAALLSLAFLATAGQAQERVRHRDRPLTITRHAGSAARGTGIEVRDHGNEIVAWGGFSANGYGYGRMGGAAARREVRNEAVRARTDGVYGYGFDGLGGTGFDDDLRSGYDNPTYGNAYNGYVGYNGVPTALAFGPGFANRHITDSDDEDVDLPGPTPGEIGYAAAPAAFSSDD